MNNKSKYYVVWKGVIPGIYTNWTDCQLQTKGYEGAIYKSFKTREEADIAYNFGPQKYIETKSTRFNHKHKEDYMDSFHKDVILNSVCIDAISTGNPGMMEYRGVYTATGEVLFQYGPIWATSNIGDFLAIVHGLAFIKQHGWDMPLYTDNINAAKWVDLKKCKTRLPIDNKTLEVHELIVRAQYWLMNNSYTTHLLKWETDKWGEIPVKFTKE